MMTEVVVQDKGKMLEKIQALPKQFIDSWTSLWTKDLPWKKEGIKKVVIAGMGGSGVVGRLACDLFQADSELIFSLLSDYNLPAWVSGDTLVIVVSYSGNTEEMLSVASQCKARKARLVVITSGGKLLEHLESPGYLAVDYHSQPRLAIGWLYGLLLVLLSKMKLVNLSEAKYMAAVEELETVVKNKTFLEKAEMLAVNLSNRIPIIVGYPPQSAVAYRWQTDINENAKTTAFSATIPEFCHNLLAGLDFPSMEKLALVLIESKYAFSRNVARGKVLENLASKRGLTLFPISVRSGSALAEQMLYLYFGELFSYYLAGINGIDPSPIEVIETFKKDLVRL